jgi:hypothetical protein
METLMQVVLWGIASDEILQKTNSEMSIALIDVIELLPAIDRRNVYVAQVLQPKQGDYPFRVGYDHNGKKQWWAGDSFHIAVQHLRDAMSPAGVAESQRLGIPMPGEEI